MSIEAMKQVLEALEKARGHIVEAGGSGWKLEAQRCINAMTVVRTVIESAKKQEPSKALQLADALEKYDICSSLEAMPDLDEVAAELRRLHQAIARAEHLEAAVAEQREKQTSVSEVEPVAWQDTAKHDELVASEDWDNIDPQWHWMYRPLYTHPPVPQGHEPKRNVATPREPLTDEQAIDAQRYRLLRRGQYWSVIDGVGDVLRTDELDIAIDAAIKLFHGIK